MATNIKFIPSQMDPLAASTTEAARESPFRLLKQDVGVLLSNLSFLPWMVLPFRTSDKTCELYMNRRQFRTTTVQAFICLFEVVLLILAPLAIVILPGGISIAIAALSWLIIYFAYKPLQGQRIVYSTMDESAIAAAKQFENERWIFINGIMTV